MKVAFYGRYSTDMQREASIADQLRNCARYAEREGWKITQRYEDKGISGTSKDRPGYKRMMAASRDKLFDVLLFDDLSRLSRDSVETQQVLRRLRFQGVRVIAVSDGYDSDSKAHKIQAGFKGMMNEIFLDDLAEKTHRGLMGQALKGNNCGGRAYGYKHVPIEDSTRKDEYGRPVILGAKREIDPGQAKWVKRIFQWYADGYSPRWIAAKLNRLGVSSPRSSIRSNKPGTWAMSSVYGDMTRGTGILNNSIYVGKYVWNRSRWVKDPDTGRKKRLERPESEWVVTDMPELRIVQQDLWDTVKARQKGQHERSKKVRAALHADARTGAGPKYLFSGLLKCGACGGNYVVVDRYNYGCAVYKDRGEAVCANTMKVSRKVVEDRLLEGIKTELFTPEAVELFMAETKKLLAERRANKTESRDGLRDRLNKVEIEISNIMAAIKAGILTTTTKAELEKAEAKQAEFKKAMNCEPELAKVVDFLPRAIDRYKKLIADLSTTLQPEVHKARYQIKQLLGDEIKLIPQEDYLEAEIKGDYAGLLSIAAPKISLVAGTGFEPVTFGL